MRERCHPKGRTALFTACSRAQRRLRRAAPPHEAANLRPSSEQSSSATAHRQVRRVDTELVWRVRVVILDEFLRDIDAGRREEHGCRWAVEYDVNAMLLRELGEQWPNLVKNLHLRPLTLRVEFEFAALPHKLGFQLQGTAFAVEFEQRFAGRLGVDGVELDIELFFLLVQGVELLLPLTACILEHLAQNAPTFGDFEQGIGVEDSDFHVAACSSIFRGLLLFLTIPARLFVFRRASRHRAPCVGVARASDSRPMEWWLWLVAGLFCLVVEMFTPGSFVFVFFAAGSFSAAVVQAMGWLPFLWQQSVVAIALALFSLLVFRRRLLRLLAPRGSYKAVDDFVGEFTTASSDIAPQQTGKVEFRGTVWSARNNDTRALATGQRCVIIGVDGLTLLVRHESEGA